jgi:hypothetical protein
MADIFTSVGALTLSLCFSAAALASARSSARSSATRRAMAGGRFYHSYEEDDEWDSSAGLYTRFGPNLVYNWDASSGLIAQENYGTEGRSVILGAIRFRVDEPEGRRYILSVEGTFNETGVVPADMAEAMADWPFYPRSDLIPVWHALRASLIRNLRIPPDEEYHLESEPRVHELGVKNDVGDETLFTFHENKLAIARGRARKVVDRLDMKGLKRKLWAPDSRLNTAQMARELDLPEEEVRKIARR